VKILKTHIVILCLRLLRKLRHKDELMTVRRGGTGVKNALIILPDGQGNSRIARYFLKSVYEKKESKLSFLMNTQLYHSFTGPFPADVQTYSGEDIGRHQLPKKDLIEKVTSRKFHAVVDMHPNFNLATAYLTYLSHAPVRVGFRSRFSEHFFNIQIDRKSTDFLEKGYLSIQKLLNL